MTQTRTPEESEALTIIRATMDELWCKSEILHMQVEENQYEWVNRDDSDEELEDIKLMCKEIWDT